MSVELPFAPTSYTSTTRLPCGTEADASSFTCGTPAKCTTRRNAGENVQMPSPFGVPPSEVPSFWPSSVYDPARSLTVAARESAGGHAFSLRHLPLLDLTAMGGSW